MTFFSNPNRGTFPPSYGQYGRQNPFRQQQYFNPQPNPFSSRQQDFSGPMNPNNRWEQNFNPYNWQQPFYAPYDRQQQFFDQDSRQQQQIEPYNRQQQSFGRPSLMDGFNSLMGHANTLSNGVNMMRQIGSIIGFLR